MMFQGAWLEFPESQQAVRTNVYTRQVSSLSSRKKRLNNPSPSGLSSRCVNILTALPLRPESSNSAIQHSMRQLIVWLGPSLQLDKGRDKPIAILLEQGPQIIAAMLGVLKAGHFYVPLDPAYPLPRLTYMLEDSQAVLLITNNQHLHLAHELAPSGSHVLNIDQLPPICLRRIRASR